MSMFDVLVMGFVVAAVAFWLAVASAYTLTRPAPDTGKSVFCRLRISLASLGTATVKATGRCALELVC